MAKATIHGAEYAIKDIFSDRFVFNIPRYQRPYLWEWEEHAETLFDDLVSFMKDDNTPVKEMNPYFLGSIVLKKEDNEPEADVIDGQQRLITLTILLSALRTSVNEEYANAITEYLYDPANLIEGTPARYRLEIRDKDADYFRKNIQDESKILDAKNEDTTKLSDARKNIIINAKNYLEKIDELSADKRVRLAKFIANQCYIVVVSTTQLESAYRVFSILNDRGLELSVTDILKAEMIGEISEEKQDHYTEEWENKEVSLGRDSFERLFSHIRMIELKRKMGDSVLKEFRTDITPKKYKPITFIDEVLTPYAEAFVMMTPPTYEAEELSEEINEKLKWLNRIDNSDWVPPSLLYMSKFVNQPKKILRFFTKLERLAAGMMIVRDNVNKRIERYATILTEIESGANLFLKGSPLNLSKEEQKSIICKL
ncbi:MAG: DUF262 domain-containing protein, partial [bacterium]|nr:DUF262 domain-containing protein [bacterium]